MFDKRESDQSPQSDELACALDTVDALLGEDRTGWSAHAIGQRVTDLLACAERVRAAAIVAMSEFDAVQGWAGDGSATAISWLAHETSLTRADASRLVGAARLVHRHERTHKALASGDITAAHVDALARGARRRADTFTRDEDVLLDAASSLGPDDLANVVRRWGLLADDEQARDDRDARHRQRHLHVSPTFDGAVRIDGLLDAEGGAVLRAALADLARPEPADTPAELARTAGQRRADDLVELAHRHLGDRNRRASAPVAAVEIHVDAAVLAGDPVLDPASARCDVAGLGPVHASIVERFLCDSWVGRLVMSEKGEPLDVGRLSRAFTSAQHRAITARDGGCVFPGCDRGPEWCDAHHLVPFEHGGDTAVDNGALLCRRHHSDVHRGWALVRRDDRSFHTAPPHRRC